MPAATQCTGTFGPGPRAKSMAYMASLLRHGVLCFFQTLMQQAAITHFPSDPVPRWRHAVGHQPERSPASTGYLTS